MAPLGAYCLLEHDLSKNRCPPFAVMLGLLACVAWRPKRVSKNCPGWRGSPATKRSFLQSGVSPARRSPSALGVLLEIFDGVTDGEDGLRGIVGNFATELFLEGHDELDGVEAVRPEVVYEACCLSDLVGLDS